MRAHAPRTTARHRVPTVDFADDLGLGNMEGQLALASPFRSPYQHPRLAFILVKTTYLPLRGDLRNFNGSRGTNLVSVVIMLLGLGTRELELPLTLCPLVGYLYET